MTLRARSYAALLALALGVTACSSDGGDRTASPPPTTSAPASASASVPATSSSPPPAPDPSTPSPSADGPSDPGPSKPTRGPKRERLFDGHRVLAVSVDGLNPEALVQLGEAGAPNIWRLLDEGLSTRNARTEVEQTVTLPNHTGMVTGRPIDPRLGGHGVTWNEELPGRTVQGAAGERVESVFTSVHGAGGSTAVFAGKSKFALWQASWPDSIDRFLVDADLDALVTAAAADLAEEKRAFTFVHVLEPDGTGHARGFMSQPYLAAVQRADVAVGRLVAAAGRRTTVVLTADHGGTGPGHGDAALPADYTVPFVIWGRGVPAGDLYAATPGLADPGTGRPTYDGAQPVRNCDLADVSTTILGLPPVPGSVCDAGQEIRPFG